MRVVPSIFFVEGRMVVDTSHTKVRCFPSILTFLKIDVSHSVAELGVLEVMQRTTNSSVCFECCPHIQTGIVYLF